MSTKQLSLLSTDLPGVVGGVGRTDQPIHTYSDQMGRQNGGPSDDVARQNRVQINWVTSTVRCNAEPSARVYSNNIFHPLHVINHESDF